MSDDITKKLVAAGTAAVAVFIFGEAQILDMDERILALEEACLPAEEEEVDESVEDPQSEDKEAEKPEPEEEPEEEGEKEEE
jgi:hypothetical protein|tara:strand:- start:1168 stop:1413 length:246 start_codon:yes stop_codon:yes gene_type:complete